MNPYGIALSASPLTPGTAHGQILVLDAPLSFWGGVDPVSGRVVDRHHPTYGECLTGRIMVMPSGRGSSSSSSILAEALRLGSGPSGIVLSEPDGIIVVGAIVASELYGIRCPVVTVAPDVAAQLRTGTWARVESAENHATIALEVS